MDGSFSDLGILSLDVIFGDGPGNPASITAIIDASDELGTEVLFNGTVANDRDAELTKLRIILTGGPEFTSDVGDTLVIDGFDSTPVPSAQNAQTIEIDFNPGLNSLQTFEFGAVIDGVNDFIIDLDPTASGSPITDFDVTFEATFTAAVPIPAGVWLLGSGLGLLGFGHRRRTS